MATARIRPAIQRLLALSLLAVSLAIALSVAVAIQHSGWLSQAAWRHTATIQRQRARALLVLGPSVKGQLSAIERDPVWQRAYSGNPSRMSTDLERDVREAMSRGGDGLQIESLASDTDCCDPRVRVSASLTASQLAQALEALSNRPHIIKVERLRIVAPAVQQANSNPQQQVTLDLHGVAVPSAPPPGSMGLVARAHAN